ncbi:hypothetical protein [Spirosoma foliorum]|uniref:Uncharacterized protein n=1 Tax=Spirosoma foliorum TaxID=2710596 RepID=A0A7G5GWS0_9BACT|nr:hypothetical protein [Spirosoma foliorum]QMW03312.1 hypothetical protein H3H32_36560 [Spirosoma foliorum]
MDSQVFSSGEHYMFDGKEVVVVKQEDLDYVRCQFVDTGYKIRVSILKLKPVLIPTIGLASVDLGNDEDAATSRPKAWAKAGKRMEMMNALKDGMSFKEVAK